MLYVDFDNGTFIFKADTPTGTEEPELMLAFPSDDPGITWRERHHFVTTHEQIKFAKGISLMGLERLTDPTTGIIYKLVPEEGIMAGPAELRFSCPDCNTFSKSRVHSISTGMIVVCQHCRSTFRVNLESLGNFDQWIEKNPTQGKAQRERQTNEHNS